MIKGMVHGILQWSLKGRNLSKPHIWIFSRNIRSGKKSRRWLPAPHKWRKLSMDGFLNHLVLGDSSKAEFLAIRGKLIHGSFRGRSFIRSGPPCSPADITQQIKSVWDSIRIFVVTTPMGLFLFHILNWSAENPLTDNPICLIPQFTTPNFTFLVFYSSFRNLNITSKQM